MGWQRRKIFRKGLSALTAVALAFGLLHAPSMMLGAAIAAGVDCHSAAAHVADVQSHASIHEHSAAADPADITPPADHAQASSCPLANITGIAISLPDLPARMHGMTIEAPEPPTLLASVLDPPDPPPRSAS
jgi:hypothetical protein